VAARAEVATQAGPAAAIVEVAGAATGGAEDRAGAVARVGAVEVVGAEAVVAVLAVRSQRSRFRRRNRLEILSRL